jgi:broad specificity phosphatase PhoE
MLIVVRHGQTAFNAEGRLLGRLDPPLSEVGRAQAVALAAVVTSPGRIRRIVASPLARARETAACFGLPVDIDERWVELDYGPLDGTPVVDVPPELWASWRADASWAPDGAETLASVGRRVREACQELVDEAREGDIVVVSHVSPIKAAITWALGVDDLVVWRLFVAPASVTRIGLGPAGPSLRSFNDTSHLVAI